MDSYTWVAKMFTENANKVPNDDEDNQNEGNTRVMDENDKNYDVCNKKMVPDFKTALLAAIESGDYDNMTVAEIRNKFKPAEKVTVTLDMPESCGACVFCRNYESCELGYWHYSDGQAPTLSKVNPNCKLGKE